MHTHSEKTEAKLQFLHDPYLYYSPYYVQQEDTTHDSYDIYDTCDDFSTTIEGSIIVGIATEILFAKDPFNE